MQGRAMTRPRFAPEPGGGRVSSAHNEWALGHEGARWRDWRAILRGKAAVAGVGKERGQWAVGQRCLLVGGVGARCAEPALTGSGWREKVGGGRSGKALAVSRIFHGCGESLQGALRGGAREAAPALRLALLRTAGPGRLSDCWGTSFIIC